MTHKQDNFGLRVASYNIRKTKGRGGRRDPYRTLEVINSLDADIVALQEADFRLGNRPAALTPEMISGETDLSALPVSNNEVSIGWHGNAVLVRKSLPKPEISRIELPGLEPRGALMIDFKGNFTLISTHLGLTRFHRKAQLTALVRALKDKSTSLILGDFNEWSSTQGMEPLEARFDIHSPGRTFHAARPMAALDRIALDRSIRLMDAGVTETKLAKRASDHLPIWADVSIPSRDNREGSSAAGPP